MADLRGRGFWTRRTAPASRATLDGARLLVPPMLMVGGPAIAASLLLPALALVGSCLLPLLHGRAPLPAPPSVAAAAPSVVLPGEFEPQEAILLAIPREARSPYPEWIVRRSQNQDQLFGELIHSVWRSVQVVVLVEDAAAIERLNRVLRRMDVPADAVQVVHVPFHSEWIRDYGPVAVRTEDGSSQLLDAFYVSNGFVSLDAHDDRFPSALGAVFGMPVVRVPLLIQHGNLLSDGRGLCVITRRLLRENASRGQDADQVIAILKQYYGAREVVVLETLQGEATGHVDMFATFPSADTVVVGSYAAEADPVNAAILDRNAELLASVGGGDKLRVVRIPMPAQFTRRDGSVVWPTYTNVVYANDTLLVPVYPGLDPAGEPFVLDFYRRLRPDARVVPINALCLIEEFGSLHCITLNLPSIPRIERTAARDKAP